jgi:hypothetical protein
LLSFCLPNRFAAEQANNKRGYNEREQRKPKPDKT